MADHTLHFDTPTEHAAVLGRGPEILLAAESQLGVTITARDLWVRITGEDAPVAVAERFFRFLRAARQGGELKPPHILYALKQFREGRGD